MKSSDKNLFFLYILSFIVLQAAWSFAWALILSLAFFGEFSSSNKITVSGGIGYLIGNVLFLMPVVIGFIVVYLFTKSLRKAMTCLLVSIFLVAIGFLVLNFVF